MGGVFCRPRPDAATSSTVRATIASGRDPGADAEARAAVVAPGRKSRGRHGMPRVMTTGPLVLLPGSRW